MISVFSLSALLAFGMPGGWELVVIIFIVLLFFGAQRIPGLARSIGRGIREFREGAKDVRNELEDAADQADIKVEKKPSVKRKKT